MMEHVATTGSRTGVTHGRMIGGAWGVTESR